VGVKRISKIRLGEKDSLGFGKDKTCVSSTRGNLRERERERERERVLLETLGTQQERNGSVGFNRPRARCSSSRISHGDGRRGKRCD
jgi:hypothetical protein